ncbi:MAG: hypothetical protein NTW32_26340 [Chloroflexi bacterium]|nr:hypothetical protein [Chloroflexota bacterium]
MNDIDALKDAELLGATLENVTDRDTGNIYTAAISLIWQRPIYKNYGYGEQIGLALREWTKNGEPPASMPIKAAKPAPEAVQARLL